MFQITQPFARLSAMASWSWLIRGLPMAIGHIAARVLLGIAVIQAPLHTTLWKTLAIAVLVLIALLWGGLDGIRDARANPDPDDYRDLTLMWLWGGIFAGLVAGLVSWLLGKFVFAGIGQAAFFVELIAGAAFTALIIFIPAFAGAAVGRWLMRRDQRKQDRDDDWSVHKDRPANAQKPAKGLDSRNRDDDAPTEQIPVEHSH